MAEYEWKEQKSKKNRKNTSNSHGADSQPISSNNRTRPNLRERSFPSTNHLNSARGDRKKNDNNNDDPLDISLWMNSIIDGDIEKLIVDKMKTLNRIPNGKISEFWDCLFRQLYLLIDNLQFKDDRELKNFYRLDTNGNEIGFENALTKMCQRYKCQIRVSSFNNNFKEIFYGNNLKTCIHLLHVGMQYFIPLQPGTLDDKFAFDKEEIKPISDLKQLNINPVVNQYHVDRERKTLNDIRKMLMGMEKQETYVPIVNPKSRKKLLYEMYTPEQLSQRTDLIKCILKFTNAHSGRAIPIDRSSDMKYKEIKLISRHNCGYNAFQNDIVYVKINDKINHTGKVMGVYESSHKPVNNIYICKVSRDQGSLMSPLDKSFPKIHVDNEPGQRKYEASDMKYKKTNNIQIEQKSKADLEKETVKFADNLYYSVFKINVTKNSDKPIYTPKEVVSFNPEACDHFFIVCYEYWDPYFMYPHGKIVGKISSYDTLKDNFHLISLICQINPLDITSRYEKEVYEIKKKAVCVHVPGSYLPAKSVVFTIDSETTKDMDDALSFHKEGSDIIIGVHVTDVTKYITSTHEIYKQAESRFCTYYPPKFSNISPIHLLNDTLATDVLSLTPNTPRAVVSVFFRFTGNMMINPDFKLSDIIQPTFRQGVIVSQYKLNYEEVSCWLKQSNQIQNVDENLLYALNEIFNVAKKIRRLRLPESYFVRSLNECYKDMHIETIFEAQILIEEFMLLANEYVARKIYEKYPNFTLLRMQEPVRNYEDWLDNLIKFTNLNFAGQLKEFCNLLNVRPENNQIKKKVIVSKKFYEQFSRLLNTDIDKARSLLQYDVYYNEFFVHIREWYEMNYPAKYECSIKDAKDNKHFSLNKPLYTHFTSPIRRFTDIIVHRLLKSVLNDTEIEDITLDIHDVCVTANRKLSGNKIFEKICAPFAIFDGTEKMFCFILDCACSDITNEEIRFVHPILQKASSIKEIKFADLSLNAVPLSLKFDEKAESCQLKWKKIIYTCDPYFKSNSNRRNFIIDNSQFDCHLPSSNYKLFQEIRRSYLPAVKLKDKLNLLKVSFENPTFETVISSDSISIANPIIDIESKIFIKNTMRIQFCKYKMNGLPKIKPELYIVAPTFQICLIHREDPVPFFVPGGKLKLNHNTIKKVFTDIKEYQEYFSPLVHVESLQETLAESSAFTLIDVVIEWLVGKSFITKRKERYGIIKLSNDFCKLRNIIFNDEKDSNGSRYEVLLDRGFSSIGGDLLCLRFKKDNWNNYWIGHGEVVHVAKPKPESDDCKIVIFMLTQWDFDIFTNDSNISKYSVDVYLKSVVSKRQQEAISSIDTHPLLKEVILGSEELSPETENEFFNYIRNVIETRKFFKFNSNQEKAMRNAINHKLSLIWGPPGTGKTHIGCILSYAFTQKNKRVGNKGVVLYCGPSNDCVNLVALEMRNKFSESCPNLLRIFGEQQELADFPLPGFFSKNNVQLTGELQEISLHYLIRAHGESHASTLEYHDKYFQKILSYDKNFSSTSNIREDIHNSILAYREALKEAKKVLINKNQYDMVLCTTTVTATTIMELFNVTQIIIDEAGMCKEPETLIPMSSAERTVQNVVLIGDHKQLRPIIHNKVAKKLGLEISLFERYQELKPELVTMLNYQYRMHPSICEFPSKEFYFGRLKTQISPLWSGLSADEMKYDYPYYQWDGADYRQCKPYYESILKQSNYSTVPDENWPTFRNTEYMPYICFDKCFHKYPERIVFYHVIGDEIIQPVTTQTGNENSRGNPQEVEAVGYIYKKIIDRLTPPRQAPNFITVLTQYKLQQHLIEVKCKDILKKKGIKTSPIVKTVIRSQGSQNDYIIFSTVRSLRNREDINDNPTPGWENQYLGFITDPNQINVALTRAQKGLIIIGNMQLLRVNRIWKRLIANLESRYCVKEDYLNFLD